MTPIEEDGNGRCQEPKREEEQRREPLRQQKNGGTEAKEGCQIKSCIDDWQQAQDIVHTEDEKQQRRPDGRQEEAEQQGLGEGIEGGIKVEMSPGVGGVTKDELIEQGRQSHVDKEEDGSERGQAEMQAM